MKVRVAASMLPFGLSVVTVVSAARTILPTESHRSQLLGIDLDADRGLLLPADVDLCHSRYLADMLDEHVFGIVAHNGDR